MIYFLQRANGDVKIGTATDVEVRTKQLEKEHGKLYLLGAFEGDRNLEQALHAAFIHCHVEGEWFKPTLALSLFIKERTLIDAPIPDSIAGFTTVKHVGNFEWHLGKVMLAKFGVNWPTQAQMSEALGITRKSVNSWLNGNVDGFSFETMQRWCAYLDCHPGDIVKRTMNKEQSA